MSLNNRHYNRACLLCLALLLGFAAYAGWQNKRTQTKPDESSRPSALALHDLYARPDFIVRFQSPRQ